MAEVEQRKKGLKMKHVEFKAGENSLEGGRGDGACGHWQLLIMKNLECGKKSTSEER